MQNKKETTPVVGDPNYKGVDYRKKRVNRLKTMIIIIVILCLVLPTIFCILLGIQVNNLQKQVKELSDAYQQNEKSYSASNYINDGDDLEDPAATTVLEQVNLKKMVEIRPLELTLIPTVLPSELPTHHVITPQSIDMVIDSTSDLTDNNSTSDSSKSSENEDKNLALDEIDSVIEQSSNSKEVLDSLASNTESVKDIDSEITGIYAGKKVYLTFDDGPSMYTDDILDILADYKVKATFFVIGKTDKHSKKLYRRIVNEGHTLGMHSYSHKYKYIYNSVEDFDKDFTKLWKLLYDTTGYKPSIFRFPGGSDNLVNENGMEEYVRYLNNAKVVYYDWNVLNGDATGITYTKNQLVDNVLSGVAVKKTSIVLMHDAQNKVTTVDSLPGLLDELIAGGAIILPLNDKVVPIQMIKADSIK